MDNKSGKVVSISCLRGLPIALLLRTLASFIMLAVFVYSYFVVSVGYSVGSTGYSVNSLIYEAINTIEAGSYIACFICVKGIDGLTGRFVTAARLYIITVIVFCITILFSAMIVYIGTAEYTESKQLVIFLWVFLLAADRFLYALAFMYLLTGIADVLCGMGAGHLANGPRILGRSFLYINAVMLTLTLILDLMRSNILLHVEMLSCVLCTVMESLAVYIAARSTFMIWRELTEAVAGARSHMLSDDNE